MNWTERERHLLDVHRWPVEALDTMNADDARILHTNLHHQPRDHQHDEDEY